MKRFLRIAAVPLLALPLLAACQDGTGTPTTGDLVIEIGGLPGGGEAAVTVTGPNGFTHALTRTEALSDLKPGEYQISAADLTFGDVQYGPIEQSRTITIAPGVAQTVEVRYVNLNTTLTVKVRGLPDGTSSTLRVTGPGGFDRTITGTARLAGLGDGTYTITSTGVVVGDSSYQARPVRQEYVMTGYYPGAADVIYSPAGSKQLNLRVGGLYLLNAVQNAGGTIPLVQGRDAFLRVFAVADQANSASPWVRVRVYQGSTLLRTLDAAPGSPSMPTAVEEGVLERSWNVVVPGELVQPGMRVDALVDPDNGVVEANEDDNLYTVAGGPVAIDVVAPPPLQIRFVPVHQSGNNLTGKVSDANKGDFLVSTRKLFPVPSDIQAEVRAPYTSTGPVLGSDGTGWRILLSELAALRVAEVGRESPVHYYGVVRVGYPSGVAGMAYVPGSPVPGGAALGWDYLPSGERTVAHELGHNWGRHHAPCNSAGGPDPAFPYGGGTIGVYGYDMETRRLKTPADFDLMGYCRDPWISDYTYEAVSRFRTASASRASRSSAVHPSLLVWGRMSGTELVLEPAFRVDTRPVLPEGRGPYTLHGLDAAGAVLFSHSFAGEPVAHGRPDERVFAFAIPLPPEQASRLATLRVSDNGRHATVRSPASAAPQGAGRDLAVSLAADGDHVSIRWDRREAEMVMVRNGRTGQILSFARGGRARILAAGDPLELVVSDGARSVTHRALPGVD